MPFCPYRLNDLLDMTDRQIYDLFYAEIESKEPRQEEPRTFQSERRQVRKSSSYKDNNGFTWSIPETTDKTELEIDGRPISGEAALDNFVRMGLVKKEDAQRVKEQRRAYLESLKRGEGDGKNSADAGGTEG